MRSHRLSSARSSAAALGLCALFAMGATAQAEVYVYEMPDGSRMITDHPINDRHTRVVRVAPDVKNAGRLAAQKNSPVFREDSSTYDRLIRRYAEEHGVDFALVKAVMQAESSFNPYAVSHKGARGLMQMMPETARRYGVRDIYNPVENIRAGVRHLRYLLDVFNNKLYLVIAAYNAGENAVKQHQGIPPFPETQLYVRKVMQYQRQYSARYRLTTLAANPTGG